MTKVDCGRLSCCYNNGNYCAKTKIRLRGGKCHMYKLRENDDYNELIKNVQPSNCRKRGGRYKGNSVVLIK